MTQAKKDRAQEKKEKAAWVSFDSLRFIKKTRLELIVLGLIVIATAALLPWNALTGLYSLMASKILTLTLGVLLAHLLRIVAFSYLNLGEMIEKKQAAGVIFTAVWYGVIIYSMAVGG